MRRLARSDSVRIGISSACSLTRALEKIQTVAANGASGVIGQQIIGSPIRIHEYATSRNNRPVLAFVTAVKFEPPIRMVENLKTSFPWLPVPVILVREPRPKVMT